ncbi:hypothetical protein VA599_09060 [Chromobacterium sp. TRC.1.1.SA]|uniref:ParB/Sulfiredoxin domain-containing protein n=1 Tax=Chromobacterium indicum TaxID=3110228 RepID=A0ABV0CI95_9NEIS
MHFHHPVENIEFDIPDRWWIEAGADRFKRSASSFPSSSTPAWPTQLVSIADVTAPRRNKGIVGLGEERTISLLRAMVTGLELPPLEVHQPPDATKFVVRDGFHRYFLSIALGFSKLPVSVRPYFDINTP